MSGHLKARHQRLPCLQARAARYPAWHGAVQGDVAATVVLAGGVAGVDAAAVVVAAAAAAAAVEADAA